MEQFKYVNRRKSKPKEKLNIAMFGQKRIPSTENFQCKISAIYMIAIFIALPVITFIVLFKKKEWNYNVD